MRFRRDGVGAVGLLGFLDLADIKLARALMMIQLDKRGCLLEGYELVGN